VTKEKYKRKVGQRVLTTFKLEGEVTSLSGSAKTDRHDITEQLLIVALNIITPFIITLTVQIGK
jgi:hypothetical protein